MNSQPAEENTAESRLTRTRPVNRLNLRISSITVRLGY